MKKVLENMEFKEGKRYIVEARRYQLIPPELGGGLSMIIRPKGAKEHYVWNTNDESILKEFYKIVELFQIAPRKGKHKYLSITLKNGEYNIKKYYNGKLFPLDFNLWSYAETGNQRRYQINAKSLNTSGTTKQLFSTTDKEYSYTTLNNLFMYLAMDGFDYSKIREMDLKDKTLKYILMQHGEDPERLKAYLDEYFEGLHSNTLSTIDTFEDKAMFEQHMATVIEIGIKKGWLKL